MVMMNVKGASEPTTTTSGVDVCAQKSEFFNFCAVKLEVAKAGEKQDDKAFYAKFKFPKHIITHQHF